MSDPVRVMVHWQSEKIAHLPSSSKYLAVARFHGHDAEWPEQAWSAVIEFPEPEVSRAPSFEATACFLAPSAPLGRLTRGHSFGLYEGRKKTATVEVL